MTKLSIPHFDVGLSNDDRDECLLFQVPADTLHDKVEALPDMLFLDLKNLPVILFSTSLQKKIVNFLLKHCAQFFRKPNDFSERKNLIQLALTNATALNYLQPLSDNFVLFNLMS